MIVGMPFVLSAPDELDQSASALFQKAFNSPPPDFPIHFVARRASTSTAAAYVHFTQFESGVYLIGGLCVRASEYRALSPEERARMARAGSLSRWVLEAAIARLAPKRAVFAYTGDVRSIRDVLALGFSKLPPPHLFVQWHADDEGERASIAERIARIGPF